MQLKSVENLGREFRDSILRLLREYSEALILALVMAFILRWFVFATYKISNSTMEPSLKLGDFIVGYKLPFGFELPFSNVKVGQTLPQRGDIVIFKCPKPDQQSCIKRVVGLPGDRIEVQKQRLSVNGHLSSYSVSTGRVSGQVSGLGAHVVLDESALGHHHNILITDNAAEQDFGPYIVPPDHFFVLADNRDYGEDSRHWGALPVNSIEARALFIWFSVEWFYDADSKKYRSSTRWDRIFTSVD